jgi:uracil-DNA glycosylase
VQAGASAKILIVGQAPGAKVHASGTPWDDPSGRTLRSWLGLTPEEFYDPGLVALVPMGFCYPGSTPSGDRPPRGECAPLWHEKILALLPPDRFTILVGSFAHKRYVADGPGSLTASVSRWDGFLPSRIVLPHPSPRNRRFLTDNPWFETETIPALRARIEEIRSRRST